jgi:hypothetical protein
VPKDPEKLPEYVTFTQTPLVGVSSEGVVTCCGVGVRVGVTSTVSLTICNVGIGVGVTSTVSLTMCDVGVATGAVLVESELMHPLIKTIPVTRTVKIPIAFHFFIARTSNTLICGLYSIKYFLP